MNEPVITRFGNGQTLLSLPTDRFKTEYLTVQFATPLDDAAQALTATLAVMERGSTAYPSRLLLSRRLDELYSATLCTCNRKVGDMQVWGFSLDFLARRFTDDTNVLDAALDVLSGVLYHPFAENGAFRAEDTRIVTRELCDAIRAAVNNPRAYALAKCRKLLCADEPYARSLLGEEETFAALTPKALYECYRARVAPQKPFFFYAGAEEPAAVCALLEKHFTAIGDARAPYRAAVRPAGERREGGEQLPVSQGKLVLGFRANVTYGHPLDAALVVLNEIFGGSPASKLFLNVREAMGICYTCFSSLDLYKGVLMAQAGVESAHRAVTEAAMLAQFAAVRAGEITETELNAAKASLAFAYRQSEDDPSLLADIYINRRVAGIAETRTAWRERIAAVTREQIAAVAAMLKLGACYFLDGTLSAGEEEA